MLKIELDREKNIIAMTVKGNLKEITDETLIVLLNIYSELDTKEQKNFFRRAVKSAARLKGFWACAEALEDQQQEPFEEFERN